MRILLRKLSKFRKKHRIQSQELAVAANIAPSILSRIENGWLPLTSTLATKLVAGYRSLGIDADWIFSCVTTEVGHEN
jgi:transcriptional regulator with XRE-family HTH domain